MKIFLFLVSIFSLSQSASLAKLAAAPPELISFWRLLIAGLIMGSLTFYKDRNLTHLRNLKGREFTFAILSGIFFWIHLWSFPFAAQNTPVANVMIIFSTNPMFTALISILWLKESFAPRLLIAYFLAILGIYVLVHNGLKFDEANTQGNLAALIAALSFSAYVLCGHQVRKKIDNTSYTFFIYSLAAILFGLSTGARGLSFTNYPFITWLSVAGLIIVSTLLGHVLFTYLLQHLNINWMSTGKLAEPVMASISAYLFFHEVWTSATFIAFSCTAGSLIILLAPWKHLNRIRIRS